MEIHEAIDLLRDAVGHGPGLWADLGAGAGTFTRALAEILGAGSVVYAVDDDPGAVRALGEFSAKSVSRVVAVKADFTGPFELPGIGDEGLDGILLANALHFVRDARDTLARLVERLRTGGRLVVVEYDRRAASRWVPYPIALSQWPALALSAGLTGATVTATRPSAYQGILYAGAATKS